MDNQQKNPKNNEKEYSFKKNFLMFFSFLFGKMESKTKKFMINKEKMIDMYCSVENISRVGFEMNILKKIHYDEEENKKLDKIYENSAMKPYYEYSCN